ncbi:MAG: ABC transporter permease [Gammaproteobacteria bacterium]|nr:ABC transporter permease [Gammaproteobacteria bacterium]
MFGTIMALALREIQRHKMRSFLTTLGIIIGVASVVTMVTIGKGATAAVQAQLASLGSNVLTVRPGAGFGRGGGGPPPPPFKESDADAIREQVAGVLTVAPQVQAAVTVVRSGQNWSTTLFGTTNDYFEVSGIALDAGRRFSEPELQAGKAVCVVGATVAANLFRDGDPLGRQFRVRDVSCEVIGVMARRGQAGFGQDQDDQVVMPLKTAERRIVGNRDIRAIQVAVDRIYSTSAVSASITQLLRERRKLQDGIADNFNIFDSKQFLDAVSGTSKTMTMLLGAVAAVSLVVGGIGIMNIMLVSVTERTREIGIRLAIGAVQREVLTQFLVEAVTLSCLGGLIGLLVALAATLSLAPVMRVPFSFDWQINALAFLFSAGIGIAFGYFPARRAASLNPIDALRHE